jgi:hypothetical protein
LIVRFITFRSSLASDRPHTRNLRQDFGTVVNVEFDLFPRVLLHDTGKMFPTCCNHADRKNVHFISGSGSSTGYATDITLKFSVKKTVHVWIVNGQNIELFSTFLQHVRFQVLTAANMKMALFWVAAPSSLVEVYQRFRGACCLPPDYTTQHPRRKP